MMQNLSDQIEEVILRHDRRGMTGIRQALNPGYCLRASNLILANPGTVVIGTGFPVAGTFESDVHEFLEPHDALNAIEQSGERHGRGRRCTALPRSARAASRDPRAATAGGWRETAHARSTSAAAECLRPLTRRALEAS